MPLFTEITQCKTDTYDCKNVSLAFIAISLITKYFKSSSLNREKFCNNGKYFSLSIGLNENVFALRRREWLEVDKFDGQHNVQHYNIQHNDAQNNEIDHNGLHFGSQHTLHSTFWHSA